MSVSVFSAREPAWVRRVLISVVLLFLGLFLLLPIGGVFQQAFSQGWTAYATALSDDDALNAIGLTLLVVLITVPLNVAFGIAAAWCIARFEFRGKSLLTTLIDLPFSVSPVVAGLMMVLLFGIHAPVGGWLATHGFQVIYALPGIVLASAFVTFPFVARELIPLMQSQGADEEQAALVLGASGWQTFRRVTLPNIRWGLLYGVILTNARAMGEFGAVSVVSGHISGLTMTLPLHVELLYNDYDMVGAFACASILTLLALLTLLARSLVEWRQNRPVDVAAHVSPVRTSPGASLQQKVGSLQ
jgi:sulfate transport system permease protein